MWIFERLRDEHDFEGGYTIVKEAVREWKQTWKEVFLPLSHPVWSIYSNEHFDRENKGIETRQAVRSQLKCPCALVRRRSNLGAEKQI